MLKFPDGLFEGTGLTYKTLCIISAAVVCLAHVHNALSCVRAASRAQIGNFTAMCTFANALSKAT